MDEDKQIEEIEKMAYSICCMCAVSEYITDCDKCGYYHDCLRLAFAKRFYEAGYRKQSDTVREFVQKLKEKESPKCLEWEYGEGYLDCIKIADELAKEYSVKEEK